jgi:hypothetical protein
MPLDAFVSEDKQQGTSIAKAVAALLLDSSQQPSYRDGDRPVVSVPDEGVRFDADEVS